MRERANVQTMMDRQTELELVGRLRAGDADAFDIVYDAFRARLYSFLVRLSRRRDVAEDLLEETWLRFVKHARRLHPETELGAWLFTVARNLHVSYCRSRVIDEESMATLIGLWPVSTSKPSPFEEAVASELDRRLERALAAMPSRHREVLLLMVVEEFSAAEAAAVCRTTPEAMRQRLSRARALLAKELEAGDRRRAGILREVTHES
jgi:RNA polymerase sigma-70 factor (ECF subfamily)